MTNEEIMKYALSLAQQSFLEGEIPVGAVVVKDGEIVGEGRNRRENAKNALAHAEIEAINNACTKLGGWRLWQCELFVTLEPCPMCTGAIINSRLKKVTFGAYNPKAGCLGSVTDFFAMPFNHKAEICGGFMEQECSAMLSQFFEKLRYKRGNKNE